MRAKAYPLLEQTIEDGVRFYLLNRVNKYVKRVEWVHQEYLDTDAKVVPENVIDLHVRGIAEEAAGHIMTGICEAFTFTDDEAVVPMEVQEEEPPEPGWSGSITSAPAPGVEKIIEFLEQEKSKALSQKEEAVDNMEWRLADVKESLYWHLDHIIRRIKAEDFSSTLDTTP